MKNVDILKFIDSKSVREFNKDTDFLPIEQASLIWNSKNTTVGEKMIAWKTILEEYDVNSFEVMRMNSKRNSDASNREVVANTLQLYEHCLQYRKKEGHIFKASFNESNYPTIVTRAYFTSYEKAYQFLKKEKTFYSEEAGLADVPVEGRITVIEMDVKEQEKVVYHFDTDLRMTNCYLKVADVENSNLADICVYIPLPFQKGDLVRSMDQHNPVYGVVTTVDTLNILKNRQVNGDSSDMLLFFTSFYEYRGKRIFNTDHCPYLEMEICRYEDLPEDEKILSYVSDVYTGKSNINEFFNYYTRIYS